MSFPISLPVGAHTVRLVANDQEGFDMYAEAATGDGRFLSLKNGGGHIEVEAPGAIGADVPLVLDAQGRTIIR